VGLAAAGEADFDLGPPLLEVHLEGNNGQGLGPGFFEDAVDLVAVEEQFAFAVGVVAPEAHCEAPGRHVRLEEPHLAVVHPGVGLANDGLTLAQRLHALEGFQNVVVVTGAAIGGDYPVAVAVRLRLGAALLDLFRPGHLIIVPTRAFGRRGYDARVLTITTAQRQALIATCIRALPDEGCGLLIGRDDVVLEVVPSPNVAASAKVYEIDPAVLLRTFRRAEAADAAVLGVFHSHTHSAAYPSPTDVRQAPDPTWHYVLVSLEAAVADVRSYTIVDGVVTEEVVTVTG
jgi:[CysO sulfur-carrier protein]-S-L-cysteine hydrolase